MSILFILLVPLLAASPLFHSQDETLPYWIKNNAKLWHEQNISDNEFINCIRYLVENKIIPIKFIAYDKIPAPVPSHLQDISYFWSTGKISDKDFISTIRFLVKTGAIETSDKFDSNMHEEIKNLVSSKTRKSIVIIPILTSNAYSDHGFYSYYEGECDKTCLTVKLRDDISPSFVDSKNAVMILRSLGYSTITDIDVDKNPAILLKYDTVIVLHNEYVTQREFDAIVHHPNVLHLYPNSLYAKVSIDYWNNTVALIRGHGYPNTTIQNGFDWKFDNSKFEYDRECANWNFTRIDNGMMLNCYPEGVLDYDMFLLQIIRNF